jgi:hypothetical protein
MKLKPFVLSLSKHERLKSTGLSVTPVRLWRFADKQFTIDLKVMAVFYYCETELRAYKNLIDILKLV